MYTKILVALDGSRWSLTGGDIALELARRLGAELVAAHIYDAGIHNLRFREMEPVLPPLYQEHQKLKDLRDAHNRLMFEGFESLSQGYMEDYVARVKEQGVPVHAVQREGRNYLHLIELIQQHNIQLTVLGAHGLGHIPSADLGSTALRVLRHAPVDVLIARRPLAGERILVGIDGSREALDALRRASVWARVMERDLELVAAYDPFFHDQVFKTMAASFSPDRQEEVGLAIQEELHEQIIDDGLGRLYQTFLDQAAEQGSGNGLAVKSRLVKGKAFRVLADEALPPEVDLVVVGCFGQHRGELVDLGSTCEALVRQCPANVLVTRSISLPPADSEQDRTPLVWDADAQEQLNRVPPFARPMARSSVEGLARARGASRVTLRDFRDLAGRMKIPIPGHTEDEGTGSG
jgi:nucleotide-binding universal stress UspA family protein